MGISVSLPLTRKKTKLTLGTLPALPLAAARLAAGEAATALASGRDPAIERKTARHAAANSADTVGALLTAFEKQHVERLRSSAGVRSQIERHIRPAWEMRKAASIDSHEVVNLVESIGAERGPIAANRALATIRKFFRWCIPRVKELRFSPAAGVVPSKEEPREHTLNDAELRAVWLATSKAGDPFAVMIRLLVLTGQRRNEVAGMRWSELKGTTWTIPKARTKNKRDHVVPLSEHAVALIRSMPKIVDCDFVLTTNGKAPISGFSRYKTALDKSLGDTVVPWRLHDLRRTAASGMQRLGVAVPVIERALNHVSGSFAGVAGIYQRDPLADDVRAGLAKWAAHVNALTR